MLSKKKVTLPKLISYVQSFSKGLDNINQTDNVFVKSIKSNDEYIFTKLKYGEVQNLLNIPVKLKSIFNPFIGELKHSGYRESLNSKHNNNLSFFFAIIDSIYPSFYKEPEDSQYESINKLKDEIMNYLMTDEIFVQNGYDKLSWNIKDVITSIKTYKSNKMIIRLIVDYFNINIFLLNIVEDKLYSICSEDIFDQFRRSVLILYNDEIFCSVKYNDDGMLKSDNDVIKKLINVNKKDISVLDADLNEKQGNEIRQFVVEHENLDKFKLTLKNETKAESSPIGDNNENSFVEVFPASDDKFSIEKLYQMKMPELQKLAKEKNVNLTQDGKKKKKIELINDLKNALNI